MAALAVAKMAKDTDEKKAAKPRYTTLRLHGDDGDNLSDLADAMGKTIADTYRDMGLADKVRAELLKVTEAKVKRLKGQG
jgi:hypothetical protein